MHLFHNIFVPVIGLFPTTLVHFVLLVINRFADDIFLANPLSGKNLLVLINIHQTCWFVYASFASFRETQVD